MAVIIQEETEAEVQPTSARNALASWVVGTVTPWIAHREGQYDERFEEYYRLWRGIWAAKDKTRQSERSKIITPALTQAIEAVTSEIESALLDQASLFDIEDNYGDNENVELTDLRGKLRDDMKEADVESSLSQIFLNGSIYGTGIGKLRPESDEVLGVKPGPVDEFGQSRPQLTTVEKVLVHVDPVLPQEFAIDTAAKSIDDALGMAHCYATPTWNVEQRQASGEYFDGNVGPVQAKDVIESDEMDDADSGSTNLIDYHGQVPKYLLDNVQKEDVALSPEEELVELFPEGNEVEVDMETMVEAIVLVANDGVLLKAVENPTLTKERMFIAYRHEIVPGKFWGRGVGEKGYNSQKALDANMRARLDGLALTVHPMMGVDASRMPKGFRFAVRPGRTVLTQGNPDEVLRPVKFANMDPSIFTNTSDLERMVSMSTGGFDTAAPVNVNQRNETAAGMSMMLGGFVKRSKRTIRNIESEFIIPLTKKSAYLYMQFDPERYPANDVTFKAMSVLGSMARELEQQQFTQMLNTVSPDSIGYWMLMKSIYENSNLSNREEILPIIEDELEKRINPPPPPPDPLLELKKFEVQAKARAEVARIQVEYIRAQAEIARAANDARLAESKEAKEESIAILNLAKAEAEEIGNQKAELTKWLTELERNTVAQEGLTEDVIRRAATPPPGVA